MRIAYVAAGKVLFVSPNAGGDVEAYLRRSVRSWGRSKTGSRNMIPELLQRGMVDSYEAWKFWSRPGSRFVSDTLLPIRIFEATEEGVSQELERYLAAEGQPDILWVEGAHDLPVLTTVLDLCPDSFKLIYTQWWKPWKAPHLERYDLCLVDEQDHARKVKTHYPHVRAAVWDKLIDEREHFPIPREKEFDLCLIAFLRPRKNHRLLIEAMARLPDRNLSLVCVGGDSKGHQAGLEALAAELNVRVEFTGVLSKEEVNDVINRSRIGVMASERDAAPRVVLEYMAADVPVLVNGELRAGLRYVGPKAGLICPPEEFDQGIVRMLGNLDAYSPRAYFLEHYSRERVVAKLAAILQRAGLPLGQPA